MKLTRRRLLEGAVATALGGFGIDRLVERRTAASTENRVLEQHILRNAKVVVDNGIEVLVPPLHHRVVTARLKVPPGQEEWQAFEAALAEVETAPVALTVAWGTPYFRGYVPAQARREMPVDRRASAAGGEEVS